MKKINKIFLALTLFIPFTYVKAAESNVLTLQATTDGTTIIYSGTTTSDVTAVSCELYSGTTKVDFKSSQVLNSEFEDTFEASSGTYTVKCAKYEGGDIKSAQVNVSQDAQSTIVDKIELTLTLPKVGDKVTSTVTGTGENQQISQDNKPKYEVSNSSNYIIDQTLWVKGTHEELGDEFQEPITGTFEDGKYYYAAVVVTPKQGYLLKENATITINGEEPTEILELAGDHAIVIHKVKIENKKTETSPQTGDAIMKSFLILGISITGLVGAAIVLKKKENSLV